MLSSQISLLLVDDDVAPRDTLAASFGAVGYRVRFSTDGFDALDKSREEIPEILLSDLQMTGMSGVELLCLVQRWFSAIQIVAMSGAYARDKIPEGVTAQASHAKGTNPRRLFQAIDALAENSRMGRELPAIPALSKGRRS